ncbi:hypothetical protein C8R44DRAFT_973536 [Mycena epipterygia]|nr:hypothetical protein C8R44DRAFT_973536 [Mycena epipterygia]
MQSSAIQAPTSVQTHATSVLYRVHDGWNQDVHLDSIVLKNLFKTSPTRRYIHPSHPPSLVPSSRHPNEVSAGYSRLSPFWGAILAIPAFARDEVDPYLAEAMWLERYTSSGASASRRRGISPGAGRGPVMSGGIDEWDARGTLSVCEAAYCMTCREGGRRAGGRTLSSVRESFLFSIHITSFRSLRLALCTYLSTVDTEGGPEGE